MTLLTKIGLNNLLAISQKFDGDEERYSLFSPEEDSQGKGSFSAGEEYSGKELEKIARNRTLIVWRESELPEHVLTSAASVLEVGLLYGVLFPASSGASFLSAANNLLKTGDTADDSQCLYDVYVRLVEHVARMDLKHVAQINRLLQGSRSPFRDLFRKIAELLKDGNDVDCAFPSIPSVHLPPNVIGDRVPETASRAGARESIDALFGQDGLFARSFSGYEERPQQTELARLIADALEDGLFMLAEAGTGTGKSLAYLVPAILHSLGDPAMEESVIVSTHTKNLQDQLFFKDLPLLRRLLPYSFKASLLKGRANYICMKKWKAILADPATHLSASERERLLPVYFWLMQTTTGDISECSAFSVDQNMGLWNKLASEAGFCQAHKCQASTECFVKRIRDESRKSNVVVVNHALLFSDLISDYAILGSYRHLIIDEAHHIERVAQNYLGLEFSLWTVRSILVALYERDQMETGLLIQLRQKLPHASLSDLERRSLEQAIDQTTEACAHLWSKTTEYLRELTILAHRQTNSLSRPEGNGSAQSLRIRYGSSNNLMAADIPARTEFLDAVDRVDASLARLINDMLSWSPGTMDGSEEYRETLEYKEQDMHSLRRTVEFLSDPSHPDHVFWYEMPSRERSADIRFYAAPLNIDDLLKNNLYDRLHTCVFSSATLSIAGDFQYFKQRSGVTRVEARRVHEFSAGSPFDFARQCRIFIPSYLPDPSRPDFNDRCAEAILEAILHTRRGTLVLFTSYAMMNHCHRMVKGPLERAGIPLLVQGRDGSRTYLTHRFREQTESVLFGTDSFWEGVDVQGTSLELLIIAKLPFEVPSDPIVSAKSERIEQKGGHPFFDYSVPEAVIKLRQGFGRLIRSRTDRGAAIILDNRIIHKRYGASFLQSLPVQAEAVALPEELIDSLTVFFSD